MQYIDISTYRFITIPKSFLKIPDHTDVTFSDAKAISMYWTIAVTLK